MQAYLPEQDDKYTNWSRTDRTLMIEKGSNAGYFIPTEHQGTINDNFITRAINDPKNWAKFVGRVESIFDNALL